MELRDYQKNLSDDIDNAWSSGHRNVLAIAPTGGGKTVVMGNKVKNFPYPNVVIAHRQELVSQISMAIAKYGVEHNILAPKPVIRFIQQRQMKLLGRNYFNPSAHTMVAGVQTLLRRKQQYASYFTTVRRWTIDEAHHIISDNQWGKATQLFPNAQGLGVTATPLRADGKGLGSHADGVFDTMVQGPTMRELINRGFLCDYKIYAPQHTIDFSDVPISQTTGDFSKNKLSAKFASTPIIGDVVTHYLKFAAGKIGVTFVPSVQAAADVSRAFNAVGVRAEVVSAKTPDNIRAALIDKLANREVLQLVNVDLFGEGFDLPAIEVISMARPTQSYGLYVQQMGRPLRTAPNKDHAIIIDHVGNVSRHGLPDKLRTWSLDRRERRSSSKNDPDLIPTKTCTSCSGVFESIYRACPYCGEVPTVSARNHPDFVDGDLIELDAYTLAMMRGEILAIDKPVETVKQGLSHGGASDVVINSAAKNHRLRQEAQAELRGGIAQWAGYRRAENRCDSEIYRLFYFKFGMDILTAQTLGRSDAEKLNLKVRCDYGS